MQLPDFPEVFAAGDCAVRDPSLPATAQVAYQQAAAIAHNLKALALGRDNLKPARVSLRGTLMKLGIEDSVANIFDRYKVLGRNGHLIRQATYLEMLPNLSHDFEVTREWLNEEVFQRYVNSDEGKQTLQAVGLVGSAVVGALVAGKLLQTRKS
jgi:NADH dehydrogenase